MAVLFININLATQLPWSAIQSRSDAGPRSAKDPWYVKRAWVIVTIIGPLVSSALFLACWLVSGSRSVRKFFFGMVRCAEALIVLLAATGSRSSGSRAQDRRREERITERPTWWWRLLGLVVGLRPSGCSHWSGCSRCFCADKRWGIYPLWHATVWVFPGLLGVFGLAALFVIGTSGRQFEEDSREWWSRVGGILLAVGRLDRRRSRRDLWPVGGDQSAGRDRKPRRRLAPDDDRGRAHRDEPVDR